MAPSPKIVAAVAAFSVLGLSMLAIVIYTTVTDGLPFRRELLTPWMAATLLDFYINVAAIAVWVVHKESAIIKAAFWVVLLICLGSITTCAYVVKQLCHLLFQDARQDSFYHFLLPHSSSEKKASVVIGRVVFSLLGCLMLAVLLYTLITDGSPFRKELLTPWLTTTLIDFYINVIAISAWVAHKERTWIGAAFWIALLICFGSITTCAYIVIQLFQFSSGDPLHLIFLEPRGKQEARLQNK